MYIIYTTHSHLPWRELKNSAELYKKTGRGFSSVRRVKFIYINVRFHVKGMLRILYMNILDLILEHAVLIYIPVSDLLH